MNNLSLINIIINTQDEKKFVKVLDKYKVNFKNIIHGMGTASSSLLDYFGLNQEEKAIITAIAPTTHCKHILKEIENKIKLYEPGKGIAFTISLSSSIKYLLDYYEEKEMEDIPMKKQEQHLIITIANEGYAEKIMTEAKKAGATGGTTINGRGLETEKVIKFLNIAIEPEKDIVLILASDKNKNDIMNNIVEGCGLKTPGAGICFSLPVDYGVGLNKEIKDK